MDNRARHHRADTLDDDILESEGIARMATPAYSPDLNRLKIFGMLSVVLYLHVSHLQQLLLRRKLLYKNGDWHLRTLKPRDSLFCINHLLTKIATTPAGSENGTNVTQESTANIT
ncbi:hypothetical protein TNCV_52371 [Trichonephila clavipes]|nr:hypothetical protein TNCV_52371 [Trichonephila clavipes]